VSGFFLYTIYCVDSKLYPLAWAAAAKQNMTIDFAGLRIYGLLSNAITFRFYSYDPISTDFCLDEAIIILNKRPNSLVDMAEGVYLFLR
jgi:hypothetical protein